MTGSIGLGLLVLVGVGRDDAEPAVRWTAEKIANLRIFEDEEGKMNRSVLEVGGAVLAVSQFTLYGDCRRGRRPGFSDAAPPDRAVELYRRFVEELASLGLAVEEGVFQAHMHVTLVNDGPVTLIVESPG